MKSIIRLFLATIFSIQMASATSEFIIDTSHSSVNFSIKHLMISNVKGNFTSFDAELFFDNKTKNFTKLVATIDAASVDTGIKKRDDHLRSSDFFDVSKYPTINFKMTSASPTEVIGDLSIHGVTKSVTLKKTFHGSIKDFQGNTRIGFTLEGKINRKDFDLKWNKLLESGGFAVGDDVLITVEVEAIEM